jgi:mono/diheme cytochrome c family protein
MRILAVVLILAAIVAAESGKNSSAAQGSAPPVVLSPGAVSSVVVPSVAAPPTALPPTAAENRAVRVEGEKRFRTNCGRCHMPPHKFPPRMMATIVRHMRVRALITDEDMRYILAYMTQ